MMAAPAFRFEEAEHAYYLGDDRIPSITQLLERGGLVDGSAYFTEASRRRGQDVHRLCMEYDLGALPLPLPEDESCRGYVLAYIEAVKKLKPMWHAIEEADVHPGHRFAGRLDRVGVVLGRRSIAEIKSAAKAKHHAVQTALQAILAAARWPLPAEMWQRMTIYLTKTGRFSVDVHEDPRDFAVAYDLIRRFCR